MRWLSRGYTQEALETNSLLACYNIIQLFLEEDMCIVSGGGSYLMLHQGIIIAQDGQDIVDNMNFLCLELILGL